MFFTYLRPKQTADMTSWVDNYIIPLNIFNRFVSENKLSFGSSWARLTNDTARGWDGWKRCVKEMEKDEENGESVWGKETLSFLEWIIEKEHLNICDTVNVNSVRTHFEGIRIVSTKMCFPPPLVELNENYLEINVFREDVKFFWNKTFLTPIIKEDNRIGSAVDYINNMSFNTTELLKFVSKITSFSS
jgi:hypothetical protein